MGFVLKSVLFHLGFFVISLGFSYKTLGNYLLTFFKKCATIELSVEKHGQFEKHKQ